MKILAAQFILLSTLIFFETFAYRYYPGFRNTSRVHGFGGKEKGKLSLQGPPPTKHKTLADLILGEQIEGRIVGGRPAGSRKIPHQLYFRDKGYIECGATLVEVYAVHIALTATHCLWLGSPLPNTLKNPKNLEVVAGDRILSVKHVKEEQFREVVKIVAHPNYDPEFWFHDIAIMFLASNFKQTSYVEPLILPGFDWELPKTVFVSGWGASDYGGNLQDEMRYLVLPVTDRAHCQGFNGKLPWVNITENQFCVGYVEGTHSNQGSCTGDSGGPAAGYNTSISQGYIAGIISFGITEVCGHPWYPTVYTRVSKYVDWIRIEVSKYKEQMGG